MNWMRRTEQSMRAGQRLGQHRLADAGHVLDEQVALGEQHGQGQAGRPRLLPSITFSMARRSRAACGHVVEADYRTPDPPGGWARAVSVVA